MTADEHSALECLRQELHAYHIDVQRMLERCRLCREEIAVMRADLYGVPGEKGRNPGLLGDVAELKQARRFMLWTLRAVWLVLATLAGILARIWGK